MLPSHSRQDLKRGHSPTSVSAVGSAISRTVTRAKTGVHLTDFLAEMADCCTVDKQDQS